VRNTVGFDFDPKTGDLWFTDNGRDWFSEELAERRAEHVTQPASSTSATRSATRAASPTRSSAGASRATTTSSRPRCSGPHAGSLGLKFYTGKMFPAKYQGAMFIARHGPWNRTKKYADVSVAWPDGKGGAKVEPFMTGFVENNSYLGRPVDFLVMKDGSLLVSDDHAGRSTASATASDGVPGDGPRILDRRTERWWPWLHLRMRR
jgi:glucose/arabinose dehydrogenase